MENMIDSVEEIQVIQPKWEGVERFCCLFCFVLKYFGCCKMFWKKAESSVRLKLGWNMREQGAEEGRGTGQRHKKSKLSGWQDFMRKNFPDGVLKSFSRHMRQKCVNRFRDKYAPKVLKSLSRHPRQSAKTLLTKVLDMDVATILPTQRYWESFHTVRKLFSSSGKFPVRLETFRTVWKVSRFHTFTLSRKFSNYISGNFPDKLETFQSV